MNDNKSTELSQPTAPGMHYTACCTLAVLLGKHLIKCTAQIFNIFLGGVLFRIVIN
jgi:hypothetical protein